MAKRRDDVPPAVKRVLADRVGHRCSHPECRALTTGPHTQGDKRVSVGMAAHITAASMGGARYDPTLTPEERRAAENGIWMCQNDGTLVDRDEARFPVGLLRSWKLIAEEEARKVIGRTAQDSEYASQLNLYFDSSTLPLPRRTKGVVGVFELRHGDPSGIGSLGHIFNTDHDREMQWPKHGTHDLSAIECEITNYGTMSVANIMLTFRVTFVRPNNPNFAPPDDGVKAEEITLSDDWSLGLKKLDPGAANSLRFYIYHTQAEFIRIRMPPRVTAEPLNARHSYEVNLSAYPRDEVLFPVTERLTYP